MKKAILHIGFPKTGTTSIQSFCFRQRRALREAGVDYPQLHLLNAAGQPKVSHDALTTALMLQPPPRLAVDRPQGIEMSDALFARFRRNKHPTLLLSDETLSQRTDLDFPRLTNWLMGVRLEVLAFVRTYDDWLDSLYAQNVRSRFYVIRPFRQFRLGQVDRMGFLPRLRLFRQHLPEAGFATVSFDRFKSGGLLAELLRLLDVHDPVLEKAAGRRPPINVSHPAVEVLFGAYLSLAINDPAMPHYALTAFDRARQAGEAVPFANQRFGFIPLDLRREARALYRQDLPVLRGEFGLEVDDPGAVTDAQANYRWTLSSVEFDQLLALAEAYWPNDAPPIPRTAYAEVAAAFAA